MTFENQDDCESDLRQEAAILTDATTRELNRERGHEPKDEHAQLHAV